MPFWNETLYPFELILHKLQIRLLWCFRHSDEQYALLLNLVCFGLSLSCVLQGFDSRCVRRNDSIQSVISGSVQKPSSVQGQQIKLTITNPPNPWPSVLVTGGVRKSYFP